ncbi:MAG: HNH endonuclease [Deltaproteobacteria bacterium]|nr:HNH endonuclease [Deltaproteobacteria bacterium]
MTYCIYCNNKIKKPSLEHIVPDALGGSLLPDFFKTRSVCERCNNLLGLFADGLYIKSFFSISNKYLSLISESEILKVKNHPFLYFGILDIENTMNFHCCEIWSAPCKGRVLHFHNNLDEKYYSYAGGNPISYKKSPGIALFINTTDDIEILPLSLMSFYKHFKHAERVVSHIDFNGGIDPKLGREPNSTEKYWIEWYQNEVEVKSSNNHPVKFSFCPSYSDRMMAKISLGLGYNLFGNCFLKTPNSKALRSYMWEKDFEKRHNIGVLRHDTFAQKDYIFNILKPTKTDVNIIVKLQSHALILTLIIFGDEQSIEVTTDVDLIKQFNKEYGEGFVYKVSPIYETCQGPYDYWEYVYNQA